MADYQENYVLNKRLKLSHLPNGFKTSMDSVFLASACPAQAGDKLLDLGAGVGGAGLCVLARVDGVRLTGVEIQPEQVALATHNAVTNGYEEQCEFICTDIRDICDKQRRSLATLSEDEKQRRSPATLSDNHKAFNHVIINPPYLESGTHLRSPHQEKAIAMGHDDDSFNIQHWVDAAFYCLKPKGTVTIIHRTDYLDNIIQALKNKNFGAIEVFPLWPKQNIASKRVIIRASRERKSPFTLHSGLILHNEDGAYTSAADDILREAQSLF